MEMLKKFKRLFDNSICPTCGCKMECYGTQNIKDVENLAKSLKKAWDEATKLYNKMLKTSQSTEYIDSESESEEIPPAENPPPQRTRGKGKKQNK